MEYLLIAGVLYFLNSLLKNPKKLIGLIFKRKKDIKKRKYAYKHLELGKFKLSKLVLKDMLKGNFIYKSDPYQPYDKYRKNFILGLENYMLYRFPTADLKEINYKLKALIDNNLDYWLSDAKTLV